MSTKQDKSTKRKRALRELLIGLAVAIAGGVISYVSYTTARAGESYTVYTGLIALGVVYAIKGLWGLVFPLGLRRNQPGDKATEPAVIGQPDESSQPETVQEVEE